MKAEAKEKPMSGWKLGFIMIGLWAAGWIVIGVLGRVAYDMVRLGFTIFGQAPL
jgi:hypothetical protein